MKKEFTKYEQALALKELGFNYACLAQYGDTEEGIGFEIWNDENFHMWENSVGAPLYQQVFRWFREKYDLPIPYIQKLTKMGKVFYVAQIINLMTPINTATYEEAESACLDKLIEIIKNDS